MEAPFRKRACLVVNEKRERISYLPSSASLKSNKVWPEQWRAKYSSTGAQFEHWVKICYWIDELKVMAFYILGCVCSSQGQEGVRWLCGGVALIFRYFRYHRRFCQSLSFKARYQGPRRVQPAWGREAFFSGGLYQKKYTDCGYLCRLLNEGIWYLEGYALTLFISVV